MSLPPLPPLNRQFPPRPWGLGRSETLWLLLLGVAVSFAILGSLRADQRQRAEREARDELLYLAGQLNFALSLEEVAPGRDWPALLQTPGELTEAYAGAAPLAGQLRPGLHLPTDPYGKAYLLRRIDERSWLLTAGDAQGQHPDPEDAASLAAAKDAALAIEVRLP